MGFLLGATLHSVDIMGVKNNMTFDYFGTTVI